jgi:hypothetical protein
MDSKRIHDDALEGTGWAAPVREPFAFGELCSHCMNSGWVTLTTENADGNTEDYLVLCRKCKGEATISRSGL